MAKIGSMLGAVVTSPPKAQGKKRAGKSKGEVGHSQHEQGGQGELLRTLRPRPSTSSPRKVRVTADARGDQ